MSELNATAIEQWIGSEVDHFIYRVPKKNHDSTVQLGKEFSDIIRSYGVAHLVFQLNNTEAPMEGITNIAKTVSTTQDEEVWLELMFYRDRKQQRCKMMKHWVHFGSGPWSLSVQEPASSWGSWGSLVGPRYK
jgi:uncharacterized protein YbaA (DUF1428 family)